MRIVFVFFLLCLSLYSCIEEKSLDHDLKGTIVKLESNQAFIQYKRFRTDLELKYSNYLDEMLQEGKKEDISGENFIKVIGYKNTESFNQDIFKRYTEIFKEIFGSIPELKSYGVGNFIFVIEEARGSKDMISLRDNFYRCMYRALANHVQAMNSCTYEYYAGGSLENFQDCSSSATNNFIFESDLCNPNEE